MYTTAIGSICSGCGTHAKRSGVKRSNKPNVLFVICDDLNNDIGAYGHPMVKTPNIDRLAAEGVLFRNAYTNFPLCGPSRNSFMTGLYPDQTTIKTLRVLTRSRVPEVVTMSQHFMNHGYTAARVGKIYHYDNPKAIGTDGHDDPASWNEKINPIGRDKAEEDKITSLLPGKFGATLSWYAAEGTDEEQTDGIVATESINLMKKYSEENKPFFLAVGFYRPHTPYVSPKKYFEMHPKDKIVIPQVPDGYLQTLPVPAQKTLIAHKEQLNLADDLARSAIQGYYAAISFVDAQIGRLLDGLEEYGLKENTIVLFTSDHGYHMGEHGHYKKMTLFENAARVPLIISVPGQKNKGKQTSSMAEMIDFYPTLSDLASLPKPAQVSGVSLAPVLDDISAAPRKNAITQMANGYSIRTSRYRYTEWLEGGEKNKELYDHRKDPDEMKNLAEKPRYGKVVATLKAQLAGRVKKAAIAPKGLKIITPELEKKK